MRMSEVSEDTWCAGWLIDLEFLLWDAIQDRVQIPVAGGKGAPADRPASGRRSPRYLQDESRDVIADEDLHDLAELSALVGGWHDYDRFIPLDEWLSIAREHKLKLRTGDPQ
jgi:hypothetical protein